MPKLGQQKHFTQSQMPEKKDQPQIREAKISELIPDDRNANQGTERGNWALTQSIERRGLGRSILLDKDGHIIAGNKTHAKAGELGMENVLIVPTDGKTLVAVQRTDISLDSPEGRELAIADNRAGELNLSWDPSQLLEMHDADQINLNDWWTGEEIDALAGKEKPPIEPEENGGAGGDKEIDCVCPSCGHEFIRKL
jgi:hypothetical protein